MASSFLERAAGRLSRFPNPYWMAKLALAARSGNTVSVEFNAPLVGFFAHLSWCLQFASFCDFHDPDVSHAKDGRQLFNDILNDSYDVTEEKTADRSAG